MTARVLNSSDFDDYSRRGDLSLHPATLAKHVAGDRQCRYALHGQTCYWLPKPPSDFDAEGYRLRHQAALALYAEQLRQEGFIVYTEDSNECRMRSKAGVSISGKPDIIAIRGDEVLIVDIKTGRPAAKDIAQVQIYMAMVPAVKLHGITDVPAGRLVYSDGPFDIDPAQITPEFKTQISELIQAVAQDVPPEPTPSARECRWCPIAHVCSHKVGDVAEGEADWL
ncbi:PD-(D/E)XK nuclease family protein [Nodosilinea sp. PGN35]|uniref:PD-(D/E)XK nuclease family protein n=1 Tax=Nodosilinea sp. PGN35 TaxID=3020489 RepID=UPI00398B5DDF